MQKTAWLALVALLPFAARAQVAPDVNGRLPVAIGAPLPPGANAIGATRAPQTITMTPVALAANTSTQLIAANPARKSLQVLNIGTGFCTAVSFPTTGTYTVVQNVGYPLEAASAAGYHGGSTPVYDGASTSTDEWDAICIAPTTLLVVEGN